MNNYLIIDANNLSRNTLSSYLFDHDSEAVIHQLTSQKKHFFTNLSNRNYDYFIFNDDKKVCSSRTFLDRYVPLFPKIKILWILHQFDQIKVEQLKRKKYVALLTTQSHRDEFISALRSLRDKQSYFSTNLFDKIYEKRFSLSQVNDNRVMRVDQDTGNNASLTQRQIQVLNYIKKGYANKVIAHELSLSEGTVKLHVSTILRKLHVSNRTEAAIMMS